jgi:hypothetical protein
MKTQSLILTLALSAILAGFTGCKKEEADVTKAAEDTKAAGVAAGDAVKDAAAQTTEEVKKAGEAVKTEADKVVTDAKADAKAATASLTGTAQELIDRAKTLVGEGKYQDALTSLQGLVNFKLTDEQTKTVSDLKAQIQKALAGTAAGNLLK